MLCKLHAHKVHTKYKWVALLDSGHIPNLSQYTWANIENNLKKEKPEMGSRWGASACVSHYADIPAVNAS